MSRDWFNERQALKKMRPHFAALAREIRAKREGQEMPPTTNAKPARQHRATYSQDKQNGGYLIRVVGPNASKFAGREVPVEVKSGKEHTETLESLVWTGIDTGEYNEADKGKPIALYRFKAKPRKEEKVDF